MDPAIAAQRFREDHDKLCAHGARLAAAVERYRIDPSDEGQEQVATTLGAFAQALTDRFAYEEEGGYLNHVRRRKPHTAAAVRELRSEHTEILRRLSALQTSLLHGHQAVPGSREAFLETFAELQTMFQRHCEAEQKLVVEAFWTEGGVPG